MSEFVPFPKLSRLFRGVVITEKLDGTNACVVVADDGTVTAQSRTRVITPGDDNFGFALWVSQHVDELRQLGPGHHFGEWWGVGIQRGYGLHERRFSLFNTARWLESRPKCCGVVPVLWEGATLCTEVVKNKLADLADDGSVAAPGFPSPEGIVVFHKASNAMFKVTLGGDGHKGT